MFLYTGIEAVIAVIAGILIAACTKKADGVSYGKLDRIGRITNVLLILVYILCLSIRNCIKRAPKSTVPGQHRFGFEKPRFCSL